MKLDRDLLNNASPREVTTQAMAIIDAIQDAQPHVQAAAAAVLFLTVAQRYRTPAQDIFTAVGNMMADPIHGERPELRALRMYAENEL